MRLRAGLFSEGLLQRGHRRDHAVFAHARSVTGHVARVLGGSGCVISRNFDRPTDDTLPEHDAEGPTLALRPYQLVYWTAQGRGMKRLPLVVLGDT
jgi:hypothetical protein